jgi:hypothetical protein
VAGNFRSAECIAARLAGLADHFQRLRLAGIPLVCTTDAGIGPPKPHDILPHAVTMMIDRVGSSTLDALRAVTSLPARLCRIDDSKGRLAPGYDADILAVAGNPSPTPRHSSTSEPSTATANAPTEPATAPVSWSRKWTWSLPPRFCRPPAADGCRGTPTYEEPCLRSFDPCRQTAGRVRVASPQ